MVCYHSTKTIDENVIRSNGLTTNEWNTYSKNMVHTLQVLHVEEKDIVHIVEIIKCKYDWKYPAQGREPQLCFYSDRGLLSEDMYAGYEPVSYTHLDVYKRQAIRQSSHMRRQKRCGT